MKNTFQTKMPRKNSLKERKKKHFEEYEQLSSHCMLRVFLYKYWNNYSHQSLGGILKKKRHWNFFNVAPSPKYNGLTSGVSNAIIHNKNSKMAHLYFRRSKRFISRGKKLQIFVDKK